MYEQPSLMAYGRVILLIIRFLNKFAFFFIETKPDPNAPRPEGTYSKPAAGEAPMVIGYFSQSLYHVKSIYDWFDFMTFDFTRFGYIYLIQKHFIPSHCVAF